MTDGASVRRARRGDTLIASAVLFLLIAGWIGSLGSAKLEMLWALRIYFVIGQQAQV
jgi:hypothetical protein